MLDVFACLWPLEPSPRVLLRVMAHYELGVTLGGNEREKCKVLEDFCDLILRENARRAILQEVPLSFQQAKDRWRDMMEQRRSNSGAGFKGGQSGGAGQAGAQGRAKQQTGAAGGSGAAQSGKAGAMARSAQLMFQGEKVCFLFNGPKGCNRAKNSSGCNDGRGGTFAHVCNFEFSVGRFCLAKHARHGNH
jgi:hypothetical protein